MIGMPEQDGSNATELKCCIMRAKLEKNHEGNNQNTNITYFISRMKHQKIYLENLSNWIIHCFIIWIYLFHFPFLQSSHNLISYLILLLGKTFPKYFHLQFSSYLILLLSKMFSGSIATFHSFCFQIIFKLQLLLLFGPQKKKKKAFTELISFTCVCWLPTNYSPTDPLWRHYYGF